MKIVKLRIQKIPVIILMALFCCLSAYAAPEIIVNGVVVDNLNEPIIGATIIVKGSSSIGTTTDIDGKFSLKVPDSKSILEVSYIGMTTKQVKPISGNIIKIT